MKVTAIIANDEFNRQILDLSKPKDFLRFKVAVYIQPKFVIRQLNYSLKNEEVDSEMIIEQEWW